MAGQARGSHGWSGVTAAVGAWNAPDEAPESALAAVVAVVGVAVVDETQLSAGSTACPACGKLRLPGQNFCQACGHQFS